MKQLSDKWRSWNVIKSIFCKHRSYKTQLYLPLNYICRSFRNILHASFISNIFINNARLKSAKNQAKAWQHPEAELLLFENYSHTSSSLSFKNNRRYS